MDAETAFHFVGNFGRYQLFLTMIFFFASFSFSLQVVIMVIVGATPNATIPNEQNLSTIVTEFDLYDKSWVVDLMQGLTMGGYIVGCVICGQLSDVYGRRPVLIITGFLSAATSICSGVTVTWQTFAVTRFFAGLFVGPAGVSAYVLMTELLGKSTWAIIGMLYECFFSLGLCFLAGLGYATQKWQTICMISGGMAAVVILIGAIFVPESPRWLYSTGKLEKAEKLLRKMAKRNGNDARSICLTPTEDTKRTHTLIDVFRYRKLTIWLCAMSYVWFANALVYYGLTLSAANLTSDLYIGILLSGVIEIPAIIICIFLMDCKWVGRKLLLLLLFLICGGASVALIFTYSNTDAKLILGLTSKLTITGSFAVIYVYTCEIFPTPLRTAAIGAVSTFATVGAIVAPFVPLLQNSKPYLPYLFFGIASILGLIVTLLLPKTLGKPIPQTVEEVVGTKPTYKCLINENGNVINENHDEGYSDPFA